VNAVNQTSTLEISDVHLRESEGEDGAQGFSHTFVPGEISVVLGANQSGKTDLCRLIAGLNTRARGKVVLDGQPLNEIKARKRPVAMVYQAFVNYPNLSVFDNIASPLRARRVRANEIAETVADLATKLRISELLSRLPSELSGGQQQRVAIARAMAKQAKVLLLDEPLVNLDFKLREALEVELRDLLRASNTVVIYTSSDPRDAFALGDHLLLLDDGNFMQSGKPLEVYSKPQSLAAMSLLADPSVNQFQRGEQLCALRPEHIKVAQTLQTQVNEVAFSMTVTAYETNGDESFVHGQVEAHDWVLRARGMLPVSVGDKLALVASTQDVMRF